MIKGLFACAVWSFMVLLTTTLHAQTKTPPDYIVYTKPSSAFAILANGKAAAIYVDEEDEKGVLRAAKDLADDVRKVSGISSEVVTNNAPKPASIIIGTIGKSKLIDELIAQKKINVADVKGKWESFLIQTIDGNLVVAGSDRRGTIFGIYDISEKIGVSPWYFWADAPVKKSNTLFVKAGRYVQDPPKVKYRGIFINDEAPSFTGWCNAKFGGVNSKMYATMFELLLRLKANYLWPAMWGKAFNEDDTLNPVVANDYGIVMGTSHHEPMMRAQKEYSVRSKDVGAWDFATNPEGLRKFWEEGLKRNKDYDNLITMGMRGDGDVAMGKGDDKENIKTLEDVVKAQREIIQKVYNDNPANYPQLWAIFTEVQRYYDAGLTVPDDITLLFCDNNWGYIRRTEPAKEKGRKGGSGLYYHIDMNGGPWNDRWINTTTIPKLREQFNLAYRSGLDQIWIVNVGDLKPKELPIDFIMRYAWNPDAWPVSKTFAYTVDWAAKIFGKEHAKEIAEIVSTYPKYNLWRKAEAQVPGIFSMVNHNEADSVVKLWQTVVSKAEALQTKIPAEAQDAYYQLVLYPAKASAGVAEMYITADINNLYAKQGRVSANDYAERTRFLYVEDSLLSNYYNDTLSGGKWKNMMSDIHIGYRQWSMPRSATMPAVKNITPLTAPAWGVALEGSEDAWPASVTKAALPLFDGLKKSIYYIDVFNKGTGTFGFEAAADKPWIKLSVTKGTVTKEQRIRVSIDWNLLKDGNASGVIDLKKGDSAMQIEVNAVKATLPAIKGAFFGSLTGEFSIPASMFSANVASKDATWMVLPDLGRADACMGIYPVTTASATPATAPRLEYKAYINKAGKTTLLLGILPTQDLSPERGLRIAVSIDGGEPVTIDARKGLVDTFDEYSPKKISNSKVLKPLPPLNREIAMIGAGKQRRSEVFDNIRWLDVQLDVAKVGLHTIKVFMIDPEVVLERIIVNPDNAYPSYFGVPSVQFGK
ncbi:MAG TPA: glycosyl hydrolase 115 family protein [Phnomibacter sp.]|nr:glycosyl hydrolase 115 family protein [Phnomibacter sp.]